MYKCTKCTYSTFIKCNFDRHLRRKKPCDLSNKTINDNDIPQPKCTLSATKMYTLSNQNVHFEQPNVHFPQPNVHFEQPNVHSCENCNKTYMYKSSLLRHKRKCDGLFISATNNNLQCEICKRSFKTRQSKHNHTRRGNCNEIIVTSPPIIEDHIYTVREDDNTANPNNLVVNGSHNTITQSTTTNNQQHIHINVFGKEDLSHLVQDGKLLQKLKAYGKKGVYGLADMIKEIHCNETNPENNTIIKPLEYGDGVYIMGDENKWEFREFEDVRDNLIDSLSRYVEKYNEMKNKQKVTLNDNRERRMVKGLIYTLLAMNGDIPDDLFEELEIENEKIEEDTEKVKNILRKFDKATMLKLYEHTCTNYKKDNGKYVKNV